MVIAIALIAAAQTMQTLAPPITEARPATGWSCDFLDSAGNSFALKGEFDEAPVGTDPNADLPTVIGGNGPAFLTGKKGFNAFDSRPDARRYQVTTRSPDGSNYNLSFLFMRDEEGLAYITRYVPNPTTGRGSLTAFATGSCKSTFKPVGAGK
jgi:hypothetical protein